MTCIAYRDGVLAADSLALAHDVCIGPRQKIAVAPDGSLFGASGKSAIADAWRSAFSKGEDLADELKAKLDGSILIARTDGRLLLITSDLPEVEIRRPWFAVGSGADYALGAMAMGATAEQAVAAAIELSSTCGGPVVAHRVGVNKRRKRK